MAVSKDKVVCKTPTPGKQSTRISRWKYDLVRSAILKSIPSGHPGIEFAQLGAMVKSCIENRDMERLGSISWYTTTVKLDLEVKGEIERVPGTSPQLLRRTVP